MSAAHFVGLRADLAFIAHWVAPGSRVLDIGCGDGAMLDYLQVYREKLKGQRVPFFQANYLERQ